MARTHHVTLPKGFTAAGVKCGIKTSVREDLALIVADEPASAALMTTSNQVVGAPVLWCRRVLPRGYGKIRGIVVNSGNSNVCTGRQGLRDAGAMAAEAADLVGAEAGEMLVASTGIIGHFLPMAKIRHGIALAAKALGRRNDRAALRAIMTTDTCEKSAVAQARIGGQEVTVAGIVKGAGMIAPSLATMIAVVTTDADIAPPLLRRAFVPAVEASLNAVTVDSDQSTSDTAVVMASGKAGRRIPAASADYRKFAAALAEVLTALAMAMARDGEGATRLIQVSVAGARTDAEAKIAAMSVADSPLVKTAVHGGDPNWGRIVMALGKSAAKVVPQKLSVKIGGTVVFARGRPRPFNVKAVEKHLAGDPVVIEATLGLGAGRFTAYTCDLSREYITINADYHT
ncbi:MAG TPA: bifunctional glutamate N-acetyltransferase/amino-acid acetyltransferase ArgJ [Phycisphaerae bacterium]|nr:bifunctional glutamate N-acetyltransferase/amino-acid acetyltransferase ArgJ [Phycisphaerae bacterium]